MKKTGSNARWNQLSPRQRKTLDDWLFEEELSCRDILPRAQTELGFKGSLMSLRRYQTRRRQERLAAEFEELRKDVTAVSKAPTDPAALRTASMKLLGRFLFQKMQEAPEKVKEWAPVASLMIQNDYNEMLREIKGEEHKIQRERMGLAKEKFQFDMMEQAMKALPELLDLAEAKKDPNLKRYEENAHWNRLRRTMFGFLNSIHPESAEEEAEMLAAKKEREAKIEQESEREPNEELIDAQPPTPSSQYYEEYIEARAKPEGDNDKPCAEEI